MADTDSKPNIFQRFLGLSSSNIDLDIAKARADIDGGREPLAKSENSQTMNKDTNPEDLIFSKAVMEDPSYAIHAAGWKEKPNRMTNGHLKQMSKKDSIIAAVIQTRQNQVSNYSQFVNNEQDRGWMLKIKDEDTELEEIKEELRAEQAKADKKEAKEAEKGESDSADLKADPKSPYIQDEPDSETDTESDSPMADTTDSDNDQDLSEDDASDAEQSDDVYEAHDRELERKAKAILVERHRTDMEKAAKYLKECGIIEGDGAKPFHAKRWNLDDCLRAWVRDSLTYDMYATEVVPSNDGKPCYFFPIDASTVKFSSNRFKDYHGMAQTFNSLNLLYPDQEAEVLEERKTLDLDEKLLEANAYKYVQIIQGRIERAFTEDELKIGIRNPTTDIYNNGYGVSELELMIALVTGHLNAEFYNQAYFTQGFSAKGILHIKSAINRRKLESVRTQWQHMLKGARNSFQTPIFAGVDDVAWIPLTQNHDDIGFEGWMRYLVKMICAIYQIDPQEIGIGMKEEGGGGSGMSGDNTRDKVEHSKDKGLYPLLRHLQHYINTEILGPYTDKYELHFTGMTTETEKEALDRQQAEVKFKRTVNEVREESGLPPLPGCDDLILDPTYLQWYMTFSDAAKDLNPQGDEGGFGGDEGGNPFGDDSGAQDDGFGATDAYEDDHGLGDDYDASEIYKSAPLKIEYYELGKD